MTAIEALTAARVAGCDIGLDEEGLFCDFDGEPPETILAGIREHRDDIAALLMPGPDGFTGEAWWSLYEEFTAVAMADGLPFEQAAAVAFDGLTDWWLGRNAARTRAEALLALAGFGIVTPPADVAE